MMFLHLGISWDLGKAENRQEVLQIAPFGLGGPVRSSIPGSWIIAFQ